MAFKFYKCKKCGKVVSMLKGSPCDTMCCGEAMSELKANTTEAAVEKHIPVVQVNGNIVDVTVGSVIHPMEEKHFIEWIALETKNTNQLKSLKPGEEPKAVFALADGDEVVRAYAYCNLHSLWADK
ncbi:desulfoferrodoxin family protein [Treponema sp.]|uniref:desulfoferrodoxin family protein n=1 Tax=Treponema sp. TaxID=166 RepID=UPI0025E88762|nr:desulfoferrodoxin family protein [Treponema sp.]MCR5217873.1 desulfoferrodoxin [Treponema sp.]